MNNLKYKVKQLLKHESQSLSMTIAEMVSHTSQLSLHLARDKVCVKAYGLYYLYEFHYAFT